VPRPPEAPKIALNARVLRVLEYAVVVLVAGAFAESYGFNYGFDNQVVYFLKSLAVANKSLFHNDWFTAHTTQYHRVFIYFGALLLKLNARGWAVAIAQTVAVLVGAIFIYRLVKRLAGPALALPAYFILMSLLFVTRTSSVAASYLFDEIMQPSTLGSLGSVAAMAFFVEERWFASGVCLALGGAFHANYLVLSYPVFGLAHLALGTKDLKRRLLEQFTPLVVVTLALSPLLLAASHTKASPEAQEILFKIRSPHHYNPARYERNFMPFAAWQMLAIGSGWLVVRTPAGRRLGAILTGLMLTVWTGTVFSTLFYIPKVVQIFVWRFAPNADLACGIFVAVALAQALARPSLTRAYPRVAIGLVAAGLGIFAVFFRGKETALLPQLLLTYFALAVALRVLDLGLDLANRFLPAQLPSIAHVRQLLLWSPLALGLFELYRIVPERVENGINKSSLLHEEQGSQADLSAWLRQSSPKDAIFLTPPDLQSLRYMGERAIVVDWKAVPLIPSELLGWYERLCDVTGRQVAGSGDLAGYNSLDSERLALIERKYHPDFLVVRRGNDHRFPELPVVYRNGGYAVLKLPSP